MRTIRVTGKGRLSLKPDTTRITMTLEGLYPDYGEALRHSSEDTELLRQLLSGFGFLPGDLKTLSFSVDTEYESYREQDLYKQRFAGYRFRHTLKLEFASDNERLGKILYALANCSVSPEFRISYTVKDPEAAKNGLLASAVADAREKAQVLTRSGGVRLLSLQSIDYSWGELDLECRPMDRMLSAKGAASNAELKRYQMNIEPDDIEVSDTVTVVWEIE